MSDLKTDTLAALQGGASADELVALLRRYRDLGLSQDEAKTTLEAMRADLSETDEDPVLDMLDVVTGYCRPGLRVWPDRS